MSKARDLADFISTGAGTGILADGAISVSEISDLTATAADLNNVAGINTSVQTQLDGKQAVVANVSSTEIGYLDGVTSALQTQLDNISVTSGSLTKSFTSGETASITLAQAISPAPVVSATKEVPQAGIVSKGAWDVNASASNYELHNTAYDTTLTPSSTPVSDISQATYASKTTGNLGFSLPRGLWFKPDGTTMYVLDHINAQIVVRTLSTAWDVSTSTYSTAYTFTVGISSASTTRPMNFWFNSSGTSLYVTHVTGVYEHTLSTAWDVSTISYVTGSNFYTGGYETNTRGFWWKPDGTKMYVVGTTADTVYEWHFSTAFDFSTGTQNNAQGSYLLSNQSTSPRDIQFNPSGTTMYITDDGGSVYEYSLSTAWDVTSASYTGNSLDVSAEDSQPQAIYFGDGNLYVMGDQNREVYQYNFSSAALALGTGSFAATDVGKRIQGNGGDVTLTSTAGGYDTTGGSAFTDTSTIASGSWSMRGLKSAGDADGIGMPSVSNSYDVSNATATGNTFSVATQSASLLHMSFSPDGTKFYVIDYTNGYMMQYGCTTAFDLTTASYSSKTFYSYQQDGQPVAARFNPAGTNMFIAGRNNDRVYQYSLSTAYDISTASYSTSWAPSFGKVNSGFADILFNNDGSFIYTLDYNTDVIGQFACPNEYQLSGVSSDSTYEYSLPTNSIATPQGMSFNSDGTKMYIISTNDKIDIYTLSTAYRVSTMSYSSTISINGGNMALDFSADGTKLFVASRESDNIIEYSAGEIFTPTSQYHIAVTNSGGQIDTSTWLDINTMVADQDAGDGTVHYAVSTDDRTTWSVIKEGSGVRPIVRDNSGTWQYNSDVGSFNSNNLSLANYANDSFTFSNVGGNYTVDSFWSTDGTKLFIIKGQYIAEIHLSTAYDLSTAAYNDLFDLGTQDQYPFSLWMNSIGERAYVSGGASDTIYQYGTSTGFDLGPFSYTGNSVSVQSQDTENRGIWFGPENASYRPTKMFMIGGATNSVYEYSMSSPGNLSTISYSNKSFSVSTQQGDCSGLAFSADGTVMFVSGRSPEGVHQYSLSTAWDISTASYSNVFYDTTSFVTTPYGVSVSSNGQHLLIADESSGYVYNVSIGGYAYGTSTTWANSTTNDEFYALQQALGATAVNRMDKTQLDAVTDPNHYTLGDTLDLAIALRMDTSSASPPTADGVTINYDAASLNQGAVLGTDYDYDFPNSTTVRVTSNAAQNLKIRVV